MGRKWNPAAHPRDGRGRFSEGGAASWAGKVGDKIGAKHGHADDNQMPGPSWSKKTSDRLPGGDRDGNSPDPTGTSVESAFGPGVNTPEGGSGTGQMIADRIETLRDDYEVQNPESEEWTVLDDAFWSDEHEDPFLTDDEQEEAAGYIDISTQGDHFTAHEDDELKVRKKQ